MSVIHNVDNSTLDTLQNDLKRLSRSPTIGHKWCIRFKPFYKFEQYIDNDTSVVHGVDNSMLDALRNDLKCRRPPTFDGR